MNIDHILTSIGERLAGVPDIVWAAVAVVVVAFLLWQGRRAARRAAQGLRARPFEDVLTLVAAAIATGVSAQGMWRFFEHVLGITGPLRVLLFAFIEIAIAASAVRARRNMRDHHSAGIDGIAVWALASLTAVLSAMDADRFGAAMFRLAAPLVAAWLWERGMAVERRRLTGRKRINWRVTPERVMVRLGLAEPDERTAGEVDAQRHRTRIALAARHAREIRAAGASARRMRRALARLERRYAAAAERTGLARDRQQQSALRDEVAALYSAGALLDITPASAWSIPADDPREAAGREATADILGWLNRRMPVAHRLPLDDHDGDQATSDPATEIATGVRRRSDARPGWPWLVGDMVPLATDPRPDARPVRGRFLTLPPVAEPVAADDHEGGRDATEIATDPRLDGDRKPPSDQDNLRARRSLMTRVMRWHKPLPSKGDFAREQGFSETWAWARIQEVRTDLVGRGWTFLDDGTPVPPADGEPVAEPVAETHHEMHLNGAVK